MTINSAKEIYENLKKLGLTRAQVRKILPEWWSPEAENHPDGIAELGLLVSRRLNLDVAALLRGDVRPKGTALSVAYKHNVGVQAGSLQAATCIATSLSRAVIAAMPRCSVKAPPTAEELAGMARKEGDGTISLLSLIETCWALGVPVIPMANLPVGVRKMDGAVISIGGRPAIIMSKKKSSRAWLAFIIAHEFGHISCGHLEKDGSIIDVSLQEQATYESESSGDVQEREADQFALTLLGGRAVEEIISEWPSWSSPVDLAVRARESSAKLGLESGHLVLRYAFVSKRWPEAVTALRFLSEDADAESVMKAALQRHLDFDLIADDLCDLVVQISGIEP